MPKIAPPEHLCDGHIFTVQQKCVFKLIFPILPWQRALDDGMLLQQGHSRVIGMVHNVTATLDRGEQQQFISHVYSQPREGDAAPWGHMGGALGNRVKEQRLERQAL